MHSAPHDDAASNHDGDSKLNKLSTECYNLTRRIPSAIRKDEYIAKVLMPYYTTRICPPTITLSSTSSPAVSMTARTASHSADATSDHSVFVHSLRILDRLCVEYDVEECDNVARQILRDMGMMTGGAADDPAAAAAVPAVVPSTSGSASLHRSASSSSASFPLRPAMHVRTPSSAASVGVAAAVTASGGVDHSLDLPASRSPTAIAARKVLHEAEQHAKVRADVSKDSLEGTWLSEAANAVKENRKYIPGLTPKRQKSKDKGKGKGGKAGNAVAGTSEPLSSLSRFSSTLPSSSSSLIPPSRRGGVFGQTLPSHLALAPVMPKKKRSPTAANRRMRNDTIHPPPMHMHMQVPTSQSAAASSLSLTQHRSQARGTKRGSGGKGNGSAAAPLSARKKSRTMTNAENSTLPVSSLSSLSASTSVSISPPGMKMMTAADSKFLDEKESSFFSVKATGTLPLNKIGNTHKVSALAPPPSAATNGGSASGLLTPPRAASARRRLRSGGSGTSARLRSGSAVAAGWTCATPQSSRGIRIAATPAHDTDTATPSSASSKCRSGGGGAVRASARKRILGSGSGSGCSRNDATMFIPPTPAVPSSASTRPSDAAANGSGEGSRSGRKEHVSGQKRSRRLVFDQSSHSTSRTSSAVEPSTLPSSLSRLFGASNNTLQAPPTSSLLTLITIQETCFHFCQLYSMS